MLMNGNYSRASARAAAAGSMAEAYQNQAYLQVTFSAPLTTMKDPLGADESQGVSIAYTVTPGPLYMWNGVEWSGNQIIQSPELARLVGMKPGEPARRTKMNEGWHAVSDAYGHLGYIVAQVNPEPQFDPEKQQVHYHASVVEGPQYFMGEFHVRGVPDKIAAAIQKAWKLRAGQPFDSLYEKVFVQKELGNAWYSATGQPGIPGTMSFSLTPNHQTHVVTVDLQFH